MASRQSIFPAWVVMCATIGSALFCAFTFVYIAKAQANQSATSQQKGFDTPEKAVSALVDAAEANNVGAMLEILGPGAQDLVSSQDTVADKNRAAQFVAWAHEKESIRPEGALRATLVVGNDDWPFPIPLVKRHALWYFDTKAGREEILLRRIGRNELDAIAVCRGFVEAENEYASEKHDGSELNQYAQRIISTPGKQDGLAWQNPDGTWGGPVGEAAAKALAEGYTSRSQPFHGYYFKVLKGQGPDAPLGKMDFLVKGAMIGGFALAAAPAEYRVTGVKTFLVSYEGVVYEKDLGPDTLKVFQQMELYNPDKTWQITNDDQADSLQ